MNKLTKQQRRKITPGLIGKTEAERQEIKQRQLAIRAAWDSETEFRRRVVKNDLGVVAQDISLASLLHNLHT